MRKLLRACLWKKEKIMRPTYNRKTSPKVIGGHVQRKNNHTKTARLGYVVDRVRPSRGYIHVISKREIHEFTDLIPDWHIIADGIESIFLAQEDEFTDGFYRHYDNEGTGVIWLCAWPKELWVEYCDSYYQEHKWVFNILGVLCEKSEKKLERDACDKDDSDEKQCESEIIWTCYFTLSQAKAFMLMHIFLHELGHHVDKLRSKKKNVISGGERFAENYANRRFHELWSNYVDLFGNPNLSA